MAFLPIFLPILIVTLVEAQSGTGYTTRFWDCCKQSCSWDNRAAVTRPVAVCNINDSPLNYFNSQSGCNGGDSYMCTNQSPWGISSNLAYGFASVTIQNRDQAAWCCACYRLTFTDGSVAGKSMIVQAVGSGSALNENQFDIAIPGGGVGANNGCSRQWNAPLNGWGAQYGGVSRREECASLPDHLRGGCYWRFDWLQNADNPGVSWARVACPKELTDVSGCRRNDDPLGNPPPTSTRVTPTPSPTGVPLFGQCGGRTYSGPTNCLQGQCTFVTDSFYQCLLPGQSPVPPSSTTPSWPPTPSPTVAELYGQCGGNGWTGPTRCKEGFCYRFDEWFSQCLLTIPTPRPSGVSSFFPPAPTPTSDIAQLFEQCGGLTWQGPKKCASGLVCVVFDQWYSQCQKLKRSTKDKWSKVAKGEEKLRT